MERIDSLALEGGGGKGAAYITLCRILEEKGLLDNISQFSGSSAGAITAALLSMNTSSEEMYTFIFKEKVFEKFIPNKNLLKTPHYRCVVQIENNIYTGNMNLPYNHKKSYEETIKGNYKNSLLIKGVNYFANPLGIISKMQIGLFDAIEKYLSYVTATNVTQLGGVFLGDEVIVQLRRLVLGAVNKSTNKYSRESKSKLTGPFEYEYYYDGALNKFKVIGEKVRYFDYGMIDESSYNKAFNQYKKEEHVPYYEKTIDPNFFNSINEIIEQDNKNKNGTLDLYSIAGDLTFEESYAIFNKDIFLTGSNLVDGETYVFSRETTPDFPIVYAIAISMNLPLWCPIFVSYINPYGVDYTGWYFDGGLYNNLPIRLMSSDFPSHQKSKLQLNQYLHPIDKSTFGFYLDEKSNYLQGFPKITTVGGAIFNSLLDKSTFSQFYENELMNVCGLNTYGLDTYNFTPSIRKFETLDKINSKIIEEFLQINGI